MKYLAYFQSYTNTYGEMSELIALYEEAIHCPDVVGIIIGTRPDCISTELLKYLEALSKKTFVFMEYGVESTKDATLDYINRGHSFSDSQSTIIETAERGIYVGAHLIIGLPGEEQSDYITHIKELSKLPITSLKLHQLQILKGTQMATDYKNHPERFTLFTPDRYIDTICLIIRHLRPSIYVDRFVSQSPREMLIAPNWGIKNYQFTHRVIQKMRENGWHQGDLYQR